jgi:hypothetical protein
VARTALKAVDKADPSVDAPACATERAPPGESEEGQALLPGCRRPISQFTGAASEVGEADGVRWPAATVAFADGVQPSLPDLDPPVRAIVEVAR